MKKIKFILVMCLLCFMFQAEAQTDFFAGDWKVKVEGTPNGDAEMIFHFQREDEKLTGFMILEKDTTPVSKIEENAKGITVYFSKSGYDVNLTLEKTDNDHVTGSLMDMFGATGERIKTNQDFFVGKWKIKTEGTPNGDTEIVLNLERKSGKLTGTLLMEKDKKELIPLSNITENGDEVTVYFEASGYSVHLTLEKKDNNHVVGSLMDMFGASGERL